MTPLQLFLILLVLTIVCTILATPNKEGTKRTPIEQYAKVVGALFFWGIFASLIWAVLYYVKV